MTTKTCKKCGHKQTLRDDRENTLSWRCSDCDFKNKLAVAILAVIFTLGSLGTVYAYEETVQIPRSDYLYKNQYAIVWENSTDWQYHIEYGFGENVAKIEYPRGGTIIPLDPTVADPIQDIIDKINEIIGDKKKTTDDGLGIDDSIDVNLKKAEVEPPVDKELDDIVKCLGGLEQDHAMTAEYDIEKVKREAKRDLDYRDRLAEWCHAIENHLRPYANAAYNQTVVREDTSYKTLSYELKMSAGNQVTADKMKAEAEKARAYIEGTSWMNNILQPSFQGLDEVNMTQQRNEQQIQNEISAIKKAKQAGKMEGRESACQTAWFNSAGHGGVAVKWWRDILKTPEVSPGLAYYCDDYLSKEFMNWTTNDRFDSLKEARDYRNSLDATIKAGRQ